MQVFEECAGWFGGEPHASETGHGEPIIFVGLDVHKNIITVALTDKGQCGDVREYGKIVNTPEGLRKLLGKLGCTGRTRGSATRGVHAAMASNGS